MIFNIKNTANKKVKLYDAQGTEINYCYKYDSKTRVVTMYLTGQHPTIGEKKVLMKSVRPRTKGRLSWATVKVKVKIPGSYIVVDGKKY